MRASKQTMSKQEAGGCRQRKKEETKRGERPHGLDCVACPGKKKTKQQPVCPTDGVLMILFTIISIDSE